MLRLALQELLNLGNTKHEVAEKLNIKYDTLRKAISQSRLHEPVKVKKTVGANESDRSFEDAAAEMGNACTRPVERVAAAFSLLSPRIGVRFFRS